MAGFGSGFSEGMVMAEETSGIVYDSGSIWLDPDLDKYRTVITGAVQNFAMEADIIGPSYFAGNDAFFGQNVYISGSVGDCTFTGSVNFNSGLSGSLTQLTDGTSFLIAGDNITITSASNGGSTIGLTSKMQAGFVVFSNSAAETVTFSSSFGSSPVVVVTAQETDENVAVVLTVDAISTSQFSVTSSATFTGTGHFIAMEETT